MIAPREKKDCSKSKSKVVSVKIVATCVCALLILIALSALMLRNNKPKPNKKNDQRTSLITEVLPSFNESVAATQTEAVTPPKPPSSNLNYERIAAQGKTVITNKFGEEVVLSRSRRKERPRPAYVVFNHESENKIASLITMEPGTRVFGAQVYNQKFVDDFMQSCEEPIIISPDDDEFTKQLKSDMIATKIELRERMRAGEDLCEIMSEARQELQRLGIVKAQIESMMRDMVRSNAKSEQEFDDYVEAANKLLEDKGIAPIRINPVLKRSILRSIENNISMEN